MIGYRLAVVGSGLVGKNQHAAVIGGPGPLHAAAARYVGRAHLVPPHSAAIWGIIWRCWAAVRFLNTRRPPPLYLTIETSYNISVVHAASIIYTHVFIYYIAEMPGIRVEAGPIRAHRAQERYESSRPVDTMASAHLPGLILWLPKKDPSHELIPGIDEGAYNHPVVVLSAFAQGGKVIVLPVRTAPKRSPIHQIPSMRALKHQDS